MKDSTTQAFVNFYAAMGTVGAYCRADKEAEALAKEKDIAIRFKVKDGPDGVLSFCGGAATALPYEKGMHFDIGLYCPSPEDFNNLVDGKKATVLPFKGLLKLGFVLNKESAFNKLTGKMGELMRKTEFASAEEKKLAVILTFNAMGAAITQIGNHDEIGKVANSKWADGEIGLEIPDVCYLTIEKKGGKTGQLYFRSEPSKNSRARFEFSSVDIAKDVIDGKLDAMTAVGTGGIRMLGMGFMLDALNKCLNIVPAYLA